jgi:PAS domain S-box-containing protein
LGYTPAQIAAMGEEVLRGLFHPDDFARVPAHQAQFRAATPGATFTFEYRMRHANGDWHWFCTREMVYSRTLEGEPHQILGISQDITERKQIEAALAESERRFRELFNTTYQFVGLLSPAGTMLEANQTALNFAGLSRADVIGRPFWECRWWLISPQTQQQLRDAIAQAAQGEFVRYEVEILGQGETSMTIDFSLKPVRDELGQVVLIIPEGRDISDRIRYEYDRNFDQQCLQESEERLLIGVQVAGVALARFDYGTNTVELSPQAAEMYGLPSDQLIVTRDRIHATFHPEEREMMEQIIAQVLDPEGDGWFSRDHRIVWSTGEVRWLTVRKQVFFKQVGASLRPSYAILAAIDSTDRKQAEAEREELLAEAQLARQEAEAANRSKDEFVAIVAHELRSPLNSISGWAKLMQSRTLDEATMTKALDTISRNTQAQVQLVEDLLDISRMIRGTLQIAIAPVNLVHVIEAVMDIVRPMAEVKQLQLRTCLNVTPQISGDFNRLQQIIVNLLTNAIKFTPEGGRVEVELAIFGDHVQLVVCDTGKGIAAEFLPRMFERYQQGQQNSGSKDGLGLGLAIVKHLVELHSGTITAESAGLGQGATFTVRFPLLATLSTPDPDVNCSESGLAGLRILIVDDEPDQIEFIQFLLEEAGAEVKSLTQASAVLAQFTQYRPDLLISDISMPDQTGYELLQQIRALPQGNVPAIALTAYASTTGEERSRQAGFQQHLTKPVEPELLIATILNLVRG